MDVPSIIKNCYNEKIIIIIIIIIGFLRGLIDTDFSLVIKGKRKRPVLQATFSSLNLVKSIKDEFEKSGIKAYTSINIKRIDKRTNKTYVGHYISISEKKSLVLALNKIKPRNSKYQEKIKMALAELS